MRETADGQERKKWLRDRMDRRRTEEGKEISRRGVGDGGRRVEQEREADGMARSRRGEVRRGEAVRYGSTRFPIPPLPLPLPARVIIRVNSRVRLRNRIP